MHTCPRPTAARLVQQALAAFATVALMGSAWADGVPGPGERGAGRRPAARAPTAVRVVAWRSHASCPMPIAVRSARSIDSLREWRDTLTTDEVDAIGRRVLWSREKVLVYAQGRSRGAVKVATKGDTKLAGKAGGKGRDDLPIEPAAAVLRLQSGVLLWPVQRRKPGAAPSAVPGGETEGIEPPTDVQTTAFAPARSSTEAATAAEAETARARLKAAARPAGPASPCLIALVNRAQWHTIRVVERPN